MTMPHGVSIKLEGSDLAIQLGFKELHAALYVYTYIIQNQLVGDVRAPLFRVVSVKSRFGDTTCVTYEQRQFLPLSRSNIQAVEINIRSDTGQLVSFESGKLIVTLIFRRKSLFH